MSVEFFKSIALFLFLQGMYKIAQTFSLFVKLMSIPLFCFHNFTQYIFQSLFSASMHSIFYQIFFIKMSFFLFFSEFSSKRKNLELFYSFRFKRSKRFGWWQKNSSKIDSFSEFDFREA